MNPDARATIFAKIDAATSQLKTKAEKPDYDASVTVSAARLGESADQDAFIRNLSAVHGRFIGDVFSLAEFLKKQNRTTGYCDPALMDVIGSELAGLGLTVGTSYQRECYDDYEFGITRAAGAIAESGTIILDDETTSHRLAALSPWVHVAVIPAGLIHRTIPDAIAALGDSPNVTWCTGPSKTADVEGILIEGVHGPGEQIAMIL
jgi:L-lactate dehydrogenase complex protein LldG